ncbi:hypothetical protein C8D88_108230 [Lentzea atacamensis]|uniref:DUF3040 domain-containing protein n=1 Tax=Lentzea atacamensis TaxID=531938 RepID=A0A316I2I8_9PSEU|nr:DUF3040 domain-containing protein [Lentzea atacamensis]PWK84615.1 hypothetical protein C8D88_108230 [Lentzea atacamensis]
MDPSSEQRELRQIGHWLAVNDPDLAAALGAPDALPRRRNRRSVRIAVDLLGVLCIVIGSVTTTFLFIFTGVLVLMIGAYLHTTCRGRSRPV